MFYPVGMVKDDRHLAMVHQLHRHRLWLRKRDTYLGDLPGLVGEHPHRRVLQSV